MTNPTHDYYARSHHDHDHAHDHDHDDHKVPNPANEHDNGPPGEYEIMSRAMQELLEQKGLITAEQVAKRMEQFDEEFPYRGAQIVARAWTDPAYKQRLLDDGRAAVGHEPVALVVDGPCLCLRLVPAPNLRGVGDHRRHLVAGGLVVRGIVSCLAAVAIRDRPERRAGRAIARGTFSDRLVHVVAADGLCAGASVLGKKGSRRSANGHRRSAHGIRPDNLRLADGGVVNCGNVRSPYNPARFTQAIDD